MIEFKVETMTCGHCVRAVTEALQSVDPAAQVSVDLAAKKVTVDSSLPRVELAAALADAGYTPA